MLKLTNKQEEYIQNLRSMLQEVYRVLSNYIDEKRKTLEKEKNDCWKNYEEYKNQVMNEMNLLKNIFQTNSYKKNTLKWTKNFDEEDKTYFDESIKRLELEKEKLKKYYTPRRRTSSLDGENNFESKSMESSKRSKKKKSKPRKSYYKF